MLTSLIQQIETPGLQLAARGLIKKYLERFLFFILLWLWISGRSWLLHIDPTAGSIDQGVWLVIILGLITFLLVAALVWWLLQRGWARLDLPPIGTMVLQFNTLELWQQLAFYSAFFVSLLAAASVCLMAIS